MKKIIGDVLFFSLCGLLIFILLCQIGLIPFRLMYVRSGSMSPTFFPGDLAFVSVIKGIQVKTGDVVLFDMGGEPVLHRVLSIDQGQITTQGDANDSPDPQKITRIDGKFLFSIPKLGYLVVFLKSGAQFIGQLIHG